jgi:hypothetical protein
MQVSIDWTLSMEPEEITDPWQCLDKLKPSKFKPCSPLSEYSGTKFDIFTVYLPRSGISLREPVRAFECGHAKVIECRGRLYLTHIDGVIYERNNKCSFNDEKELLLVM